MLTSTVQIPNQDLMIEGYLALEEGDHPRPAVIVVQEIFGVNNHIKDVTRRIASQGYVAIAPAIYQRSSPGFTADYTSEGVKIGRLYKEKTVAAELLQDLDATIDYLYSLPVVASEGVGLIGFCFGGHVVYLGSTLARVKATASFYGAGITTFTPGGGAPTITKTPEIKGAIYGFFGMKDASIPLDQVDQIEKALEESGIPHRVYRYEGADHGFFCDQRESYHQDSAVDAWEKVLQLYADTLR